ncbi:putative Di-N-acetylchitobiase [Phytophthora cinnamomi]|uniref:putative Di-N-acetylchitobiase n=1 Tax=Phytophthora cinnamomi TaxID=4785 RepID=UPI003559AC66|nr:putative Di-N-acetylchitobiase [Phytophthora cinnamomi]
MRYLYQSNQIVSLKGDARSAPVFDARGLFPDRLTHDDRARLRSCPCRERPDSDEQLSSFASLCLPVDFAGKKPRKEVFAFSVATDERWKHYDWDQLTTVAWNEDKDLLCHAHRKGVKIVVKHNFDDVDQLCNTSARQTWVQATYTKIVENYADGVNIDTEKPMHGATAQCLASLVHELRHELERHALTKNAQITFDVPWAPRGVDGRYYPWRELADAADFLFVMSYDMRSQVYDACVAGANAPLALVEQGLQEFLLGFDIAPDKLVLGVPWYGYDYPCLEQQGAIAIDDASRCRIRPVPFFGAPCSDAAGGQIDYADVRRLVKSHGLVEQWDPTTQTPFVWYAPPAEEGSPPSRRLQIWFDNPRSLRAKYQLVRELRLRGVGMWNADTLDYSSDSNDTRLMWSSLAEAFTP